MPECEIAIDSVFIRVRTACLFGTLLASPALFLSSYLSEISREIPDTMHFWLSLISALLCFA